MKYFGGQTGDKNCCPKDKRANIRSVLDVFSCYFFVPQKKLFSSYDDIQSTLQI